jgi:hypothetical protein
MKTGSDLSSGWRNILGGTYYQKTTIDGGASSDFQPLIYDGANIYVAFGVHNVEAVSLAAAGGARTEYDNLYNGVAYASNRGPYKITDFNQDKYGGAVFLRGDNDKSTSEIRLKLATESTVYVGIDNRANSASSKVPDGFDRDGSETITFSHGSDALAFPVYKKTFAAGDAKFAFKQGTMAAIFVVSIGNNQQLVGSASSKVPDGFVRDGSETITCSHGSDALAFPVYKKSFAAGDAKFAFKKTTMAAIFVVSTGDHDAQCDWTVDAQPYRSIYMGAKVGDKYTGVKSIDGKRVIPGVMSMWVRNKDAEAVPMVFSSTDAKELNWKVGGTTDKVYPRVEIKNLNKFAQDEMNFDGADDGFEEFTVAFHFKAPKSTNKQTPISYATEESDNNLLVYDVNAFRPYMGPSQGSVLSGGEGDGFADNQWHAACLTWSKSSGNIVSWIDGKKYVGSKKSGAYLSENMPSGGTLVLGQEQDKVGDGFAGGQAYEGALTRVNVYSTYASANECGPTGTWLKTGASGDVVNWEKIVTEVEKKTDCTKYSVEAVSLAAAGGAATFMFTITFFYLTYYRDSAHESTTQPATPAVFTTTLLTSFVSTVLLLALKIK